MNIFVFISFFLLIKLIIALIVNSYSLLGSWQLKLGGSEVVVVQVSLAS